MKYNGTDFFHDPKICLSLPAGLNDIVLFINRTRNQARLSCLKLMIFELPVRSNTVGHWAIGSLHYSVCKSPQCIWQTKKLKIVSIVHISWCFTACRVLTNFTHSFKLYSFSSKDNSMFLLAYENKLYDVNLWPRNYIILARWKLCFKVSSCFAKPDQHVASEYQVFNRHRAFHFCINKLYIYGLHQSLDFIQSYLWRT